MGALGGGKQDGRATVTGCFLRSLMFGTVSNLDGIDSFVLTISLFVGLCVLYLVICIPAFVIAMKLATIMGILIVVLLYLCIPFLFSLILALIAWIFIRCSFVKLWNTMLFSRVYSYVSGIILFVLLSYYLYQNRDELKAVGNNVDETKNFIKKTIETMAGISFKEGRFFPKLELNLTRYSTIFQILEIAAFIAAIILIVRNVRAIK